MKLEMTETGFFAFKGREFICRGTELVNNRPVQLCKVLTNEELKRIDENPAILRSATEMYNLLST